MPKAKSKSRSRSRSRGRASSTKKSPKTSTPARSPKRGRPPTSASRTPPRSRSRKKEPTPQKASPPESPPAQREAAPRRSRSANRQLPPETPARASKRLAGKVVQAAETEKREAKEKTDTAEKKKSAGAKDADGCGACLGFMSLITLPALCFYIALTCTSKSCILTLPEIPKTWRAFYDPQVATVSFVWFLVQIAIFAMPIGRQEQGFPIAQKHGKRLSYRINGCWVTIANLMLYGAAYYYKLPFDIIEKKFIQFVFVGTVYSFVGSLYLYFVGGNATVSWPAGNTGSFFNDFFIGRDLNPRIKQFDVKQFLITYGLSTWLMLALIYITMECQKTGSPNYSVLLTGCLQLAYLLTVLGQMEKYLGSFDVMFEAAGFLYVFGSLVFIPVLYPLALKFLLFHSAEVSCVRLGATAILGLTGLIVMCGANCQKYRYRRDPFDPRLSHLETIATSVTGKNLLASGWWGCCRHPNYLGDLMCAFAWSLPAGCCHAIPWTYPLILLPYMLSRINRVEKYCKGKYGAAWNKYTERVKHRLIPQVY